MNNHNSRNGGFSSAWILIILAGATMGFQVFGTRITNAMKASKNTETRNDLQLVRKLILVNMDAKETLHAAGIDTYNDVKSRCSSSPDKHAQTEGFLRIMRKKSGTAVSLPLTPELDIADGKSKGSARIGDWSVRVTCSSSANTFVIRAAYIMNDAYAKDINGADYDWDEHAGSLIFGGETSSWPLSEGMHYPGKNIGAYAHAWTSEGSAVTRHHGDDDSASRVRERSHSFSFTPEANATLDITSINTGMIAVDPGDEPFQEATQVTTSAWVLVNGQPACEKVTTTTTRGIGARANRARVNLLCSIPVLGGHRATVDFFAETTADSSVRVPNFITRNGNNQVRINMRED